MEAIALPCTTYEIITPEIAKEWLKNNVNRDRDNREVEFLARQIKNGEFKTTHQGILLGDNNEVWDGQHRLAAIVLAKQPVVMAVTRGLDRSCIEAIDRGKVRSIKDIMDIEVKHIVENTTYPTEVISNGSVIRGIANLFRQTSMKRRISVQEVKNIFNAFTDSIVSVYRNMICGYKGYKNASIVAAAIAAKECGVSDDVLNKFFGIFYNNDVSGCDGLNVNAVLDWKSQITDAKIHKVTIHRDKMYSCTQEAIFHFANNTGVSRIAMPEKLRYDVSRKVCAAAL